MKKSAQTPQSRLIDYCHLLNDHVKLLRDYGTTPGNEWLARSELNQIQEIVAQIEQLLSEIKESE